MHESEFPVEPYEENELDTYMQEEVEDEPEAVVRPKKSKKSKAKVKAKSKSAKPAKEKEKPVKAAKAEKSSAGTPKGKKAKKVKKVKAVEKVAKKKEAESKAELKTQGRKPIVKRPEKKGGKPVKKGKVTAKTGKKAAKQSLLPRTRSKVQYVSGFDRPTVDGEPLRSSWPSRTHARTQKRKDSTILCQRRSRSSIWKRDLISAPPDKYKDVTCMRCKSAIEASHQ